MKIFSKQQKPCLFDRFGKWTCDYIYEGVENCAVNTQCRTTKEVRYDQEPQQKRKVPGEERRYAPRHDPEEGWQITLQDVQEEVV